MHVMKSPFFPKGRKNDDIPGDLRAQRVRVSSPNLNPNPTRPTSSPKG